MYESTVYFLKSSDTQDVAPAIPHDVLHFAEDPEMPTYQIAENESAEAIAVELLTMQSEYDSEPVMDIRLLAEDPVIPVAELEKPVLYGDDLPLPADLMPKEFTHMPRLH